MEWWHYLIIGFGIYWYFFRDNKKREISNEVVTHEPKKNFDLEKYNRAVILRDSLLKVSNMEIKKGEWDLHLALTVDSEIDEDMVTLVVFMNEYYEMMKKDQEYIYSLDVSDLIWYFENQSKKSDISKLHEKLENTTARLEGNLKEDPERLANEFLAVSEATYDLYIRKLKTYIRLQVATTSVFSSFLNKEESFNFLYKFFKEAHVFDVSWQALFFSVVNLDNSSKTLKNAAVDTLNKLTAPLDEFIANLQNAKMNE
jgi:hypothetical protein